MRQVKRLLPYVRRYVQMAVYDVLDAEGAEYRKEESGAVVARLSVYGNVSTFSLSTEIQDVGTGLTVSMREPCPSQMQSDETGGYERVYDTQTGEIYRAEAGWYESTGSDRYKPVTENKMYAEPISGYIE